MRFEDDLVAGAGDVNGDAFAIHLPGGHIGVGNVLGGGVLGEVDGLGEGVIDERLEGCLGADVLLGGDISADDEDLFHLRRDILHVLAGAIAHGLVDDLLAVKFAEAGFDESLLEHRAGVVELEILAVVVDVADVGEGKDRLAAVAFTAGDGGNGAGGGNGGLGSVADAVTLDAFHDGLPVEVGTVPVLLIFIGRGRRLPEEVAGIVNAAADGGESTALMGELDASLHGGIADEFHHLGAKILTSGGAVTDTDVVHEVSETHDAETDAAGAQGRFLELRDGRDVDVGVDDIIEETGSKAGIGAELLPIDGMVGAEMLCEVDGAEAAILVRSEPLFPAGIGGFELVEMRYGIAAVGGIKEEESGFAIVMRLLDDLLKEVAGSHGLVDAEGDALGFSLLEGALKALGARVEQVREAQRPLAIFLYGGHEGIGDTDGNVEIGDLVLVGLAGDEILDIRMVDAEDGHVGAAAGAALGNLTEGVVVDTEEPDGSGGFAGGSFDDAALGAETGEGKAVAAAGLLDESGVAERLEDAGGVATHVIINGEDEAGGELSEGSAGAGEGGGVGEESLGGEESVILAGEGVDISGPFFLDDGDVVSNTPEHLFNGLSRLPVSAAADVALDKHLPGVIGKVDGGQILGYAG